jgi:hypothetical protein
MQINMDWLNELQNVDINDPSSWSIGFKAIIAFVVSILILAAGYYLII